MRYRCQKIIFCLGFTLTICFTTFSQKRTVLVFDLQKNTIDSIIVDVSVIDKTKEYDHTPF